MKMDGTKTIIDEIKKIIDDATDVSISNDGKFVPNEKLDIYNDNLDKAKAIATENEEITNQVIIANDGTAVLEQYLDTYNSLYNIVNNNKKDEIKDVVEEVKAAVDDIQPAEIKTTEEETIPAFQAPVIDAPAAKEVVADTVPEITVTEGANIESAQAPVIENPEEKVPYKINFGEIDNDTYGATASESSIEPPASYAYNQLIGDTLNTTSDADLQKVDLPSGFGEDVESPFSKVVAYGKPFNY